MKTLSGIMSHVSKEEYLESCRQRYPSRSRPGRSAMIDEVSDTLGWDRKHTGTFTGGNDIALLAVSTAINVIPEPSTALLAALGALALLRRRR